jgi:4-amino-4-deoxy-L-arabinose transferase-like glycosyltransferase
MPLSLPSTFRNQPVAWLIGLVGLLYLWNLSLVELSVTDEARSGMIVKGMLAGNWLLPRTPDGYLVEKPPAFYGTCALLGSVFGVNEWTLRGVSVLAALGTLAVTAWIVRLFGSPRAAWISVAALASNLVFLQSARDAMVDMMLTFFLSVGFAGYAAGKLGRISLERATGICGLAFGLALLSKGPLGLALPIAVCGGDFMIETKGRIWRLRRPLAPVLGVLLLALAVSALWYIPGLLAGKNEFLETSILSENFRMPLGQSTGIGGVHKRPLYYYTVIQLCALLPSLPLLAALPGWWRDPSSRHSRRLLACWAAFGFLLFQAVSNKRFYYIVTLQPAFAAMIGLAADHWAERKWGSRWSFVGSGILLALVGAVCIGLVFVQPGFNREKSAEVLAAVLRHRGWVITFGVLVVAAGAAMLAAVRRGPAALLSCSAAMALLVVAGSSGAGDPILAEFNRSRPFVKESAAKVPADAHPVIFPPIHGYSIDYYWPVPVVRDGNAARTAEYVFVSREKLPTLPGKAETLGTWRYSVKDDDRDVLLLRRAP